MKIVFINTHPVQYFVPLYQEMSATRGRLDLEVWYCTTHGLNAEVDVDEQFGRAIRWNIPILEGYKHRFLRNHAPRPSIYRFWGVLNLGIVGAISRLPEGSAIVISGWNNPTYLAAAVAGRIFGHTVCLRCENTIKIERLRSGVLKRLQRSLLKHTLFRLIDLFLYVGEQNKLFYLQHGVAPAKLIFAPYAVDNRRFQSCALKLEGRRKQLRNSLGLPESGKIVLFTGKFIAVKRVFDLLEAFHRVRDVDAALVLVGDGNLREQLEARINELKLAERVYLPGFANQTEIVQYYALADVLILCSETETWGLSVNEAMNFGLPILVSDTVGCADNLVREGVNGFVFPRANIDRLADRLRFVLEDDAWREKAGRVSREIISSYSYSSYSHTIQNLDVLCPR